MAEHQTSQLSVSRGCASCGYTLAPALIQPKLDENINTAEAKYSLKDPMNAWASHVMGAANV